jgi:hypothetical protein
MSLYINDIMDWLFLNLMVYVLSLAVYASSLPCYQKIMASRTLGQCDSYWDDLSPWLSNITSYQFYCEPEHTVTANLLS